MYAERGRFQECLQHAGRLGKDCIVRKCMQCVEKMWGIHASGEKDMEMHAACVKDGGMYASGGDDGRLHAACGKAKGAAAGGDCG